MVVLDVDMDFLRLCSHVARAQACADIHTSCEGQRCGARDTHTASSSHSLVFASLNEQYVIGSVPLLVCVLASRCAEVRLAVKSRTHVDRCGRFRSVLDVS